MRTVFNTSVTFNGKDTAPLVEIPDPDLHMLKFHIDPSELGNGAEILTELSWAAIEYPWYITFQPKSYLRTHARWPGMWTLLPNMGYGNWYELQRFLLMNHERFVQKYNRDYRATVAHDIWILPDWVMARDWGMVRDAGHRFRLGSWDCILQEDRGDGKIPPSFSPYGVCLYDHKVDPLHDQCLICGNPEERK